MRAARLLQMLLLLQNRGRLTSAQLAQELEVTPRTILRDVDAMTEAGLPIIVFQGNQGGIELGFNYRSRLTGLDRAEAEALGVALNTRNPALAALGMQQVFERARTKLVESFPDRVRAVTQQAMAQFQMIHPEPPPDPRAPALAQAVSAQRIVRINAGSAQARVVHPVGLILTPEGWAIKDGLSKTEIALSACGDINISAHCFA